MTAISATSGSFASARTSLTLPNRANVVSEFILNTNSTRAIKNIGHPSTSSIVIGSPTYGANSATINNSSPNGFDTGVAAYEGDQTFVVLCQKPSSAGAVFATASPFTGILYGVSSKGFYFYNTQAGIEPNIAAVPVVSSGSAFQFIVGWGSSFDVGYIQTAASGVLGSPVAASVAGSVARSTVSTVKLGAGVYGNSTFSVAYAARFARILSQTDIANLLASLTAYFNGVLTIF